MHEECYEMNKFINNNHVITLSSTW